MDLTDRVDAAIERLEPLGECDRCAACRGRAALRLLRGEAVEPIAYEQGSLEPFLEWTARAAYRYVHPYSHKRLQADFAAAFAQGLVVWDHGSATRFSISEKGRARLPKLAPAYPEGT